jgi:hypothetical protein
LKPRSNPPDLVQPVVVALLGVGLGIVAATFAFAGAASASVGAGCVATVGLVWLSLSLLFDFFFFWALMVGSASFGIVRDSSTGSSVAVVVIVVARTGLGSLEGMCFFAFFSFAFLVLFSSLSLSLAMLLRFLDLLTGFDGIVASIFFDAGRDTALVLVDFDSDDLSPLLDSGATAF